MASEPELLLADYLVRVLETRGPPAARSRPLEVPSQQQIRRLLSYKAVEAQFEAIEDRTFQETTMAGPRRRWDPEATRKPCRHVKATFFKLARDLERSMDAALIEATMMSDGEEASPDGSSSTSRVSLVASESGSKSLSTSPCPSWSTDLGAPKVTEKWGPKLTSHSLCRIDIPASLSPTRLETSSALLTILYDEDASG